MIDYSVCIIARQEHVAMQQSLALVSDFAAPAFAVPANRRQRVWVVRNTVRLWSDLGKTLLTLRTQMTGAPIGAAIRPEIT
jgi:hypothetical protein